MDSTCVLSMFYSRHRYEILAACCGGLLASADLVVVFGTQYEPDTGYLRTLGDIRMTMKINRRAFLGSALALGALSVVEPNKALAVTAAEKKSEVQSVAAQLNALNSDLETAIDQYNRTQDDYANATAKVEECQAKIDEQQKKIDELQTHIQTRATSMYRSGAMSYMDVLLGTGTFGDFATTWDTLNELNKDDADLVASAKVARTELENTKAELADQQQAAANAVSEAKTYKATIEAKQTEYNNLYNSLSAEYQQLLAEEQEAAAKAAEEAAKAYSPAASNDTSSSSSSTSNGGSGNSSSSKPSSSGSSYSGASSIPTHGSVVDYAASRVGCPYVWARRARAASTAPAWSCGPTPRLASACRTTPSRSTLAQRHASASTPHSRATSCTAAAMSASPRAATTTSTRRIRAMSSSMRAAEGGPARCVSKILDARRF